jgi:hypothetical protein
VRIIFTDTFLLSSIPSLSAKAMIRVETASAMAVRTSSMVDREIQKYNKRKTKRAI